MSEMVEWVALAISGGDDPASILSIHRSRARLALAVMRRPTKTMLLAGHGANLCENALEVWEAMIDEALK